jgi:large subunit ribosomal protein L1
MAKKTSPVITNDVLDELNQAMSEGGLDTPAAKTKEEPEEVVAEVAAPEAPAAPVKRERSKSYVAARSMVDRTIAYELSEAVELVKRTAYTKFDGTLTLHLNLKKDLKPVDVAMPFSTGKTIRVAEITDEVIAQLEAGKIEFDILLATPDTMKKIVKFARLLGPRGLMPNPKNGTITTDPSIKRAELEKGSVNLKSEKKAPLVHVRVGKQKQATEEVVGNIEAIMRAVGPINILKATLAPTMGPGVKIKVVVA